MMKLLYVLMVIMTVLVSVYGLMQYGDCRDRLSNRSCTGNKRKIGLFIGFYMLTTFKELKYVKYAFVLK